MAGGEDVRRMGGWGVMGRRKRVLALWVGGRRWVDGRYCIHVKCMWLGGLSTVCRVCILYVSLVGYRQWLRGCFCQAGE